MKVQMEKLQGSLARLEIEVEQDRVDLELERTYRRLANLVTVPGFRKGKAPRVLVERTLGEGTVFQEAQKELIPDAIAEAIKQENLDPIAEPEDFNVLSEEPFRFEVTVPLVPQVQLGDYKSVTAERRPVEVTDQQVDEVIQKLRDREGTWLAPEPARPAREGDQLVLTIQDFVGGEPLNEPQEDVTHVIGEGPLIKDLDRQLVGVEEGKEYEFDAQLPEDHPVDEVAGKQASFKVNVASIKEKQLPDLDDEFAKRVGEGVESLDELRARIRENLEARAETEERNRLVDEVVKQIVERSSVEVPEVLVEREIDHQVQHLENDLRASNLSLQQFLGATGQSREQLREHSRESARDRLVRGLVLSEVAQAEDIKVEDADIESELARMTRGIAEEELPEAQRILSSDEWQQRIRSDLYDRKLLNRIVEIATGEPLYPPEQASEPLTEADVEITDAVEDLDADRAAQALAEEPTT